MERVDDVPLTQAREARDPQFPLYSCIRTPAAEKLEPMLLRAMVGLVVCAVNWYHTSPPGVPAQPELTAGEEAVAPESVPAVLEHEDAVDRTRGEEQASFEGDCSSEMVYPRLLVVGL